MNEFNKVNLVKMRADLNKVLAAYGDVAGCEFSLGNITFNSAEFSVKLTSKIKGAKGKSDVMLERVMKTHGLKLQGTAGRVLCGYNSKAYAYPFQYTQGGKRFKCSTESAKLYFGV